MEEEEKKTMQCPQIALDMSKAVGKQIECGSVSIHFPYAAYAEQVDYMKAVIAACEETKNAMLESPTGTGKTLSLLCASLGWLQQKRKSCPPMNYPRILYLSRTHGQLKQVVRELKKTVYRPVTSILGSRDVLCINQEARTNLGAQLNLTCKSLRRKKKCPYVNADHEKLKLLKKQTLDIEELQQFGKEHKWCPFYAAREMIPHADVLFMPYNYALDAMYRTMFEQVQYSNSLLIFDEAHNVQKVAEDAWSFDVSVGLLKRCLSELQQAAHIKDSIAKGKSMYDDLAKEAAEIRDEELGFISDPIDNLINYLLKVKDLGKDGLIFDGRKLFDFFMKGTEGVPQNTGAQAQVDQEECKGLSLQNYDLYLAMVNKVLVLLAARDGGANLEIWYQTLVMVFKLMLKDKEHQLCIPLNSPEDRTYDIDDFKLVLCDLEEEPKTDSKSKAPTPKSPNLRTLQVFCFNPGIAFVELLKAKPRAIILTSGTLSPMESMERELHLKCEIKREIGHVVDPEQVLLEVVTKDERNEPFKFTYDSRNNSKQRQRLGWLLAQLCTATPGGVLVFFSGYSALRQCHSEWKSRVLPTIEASGKKLFLEQQTASLNHSMLQRFRETVGREGGAVLFAVCRGKISEGLDFSDKEAMTAVVIGVPFPSTVDTRVKLKRQYLDQHNGQLHLNGTSWYTQEAVRAVNQSVGRIVRHRHDYGAIVLIDLRYSNDWLQRLLSRWLRPRLRIAEGGDDCVSKLSDFFTRMNVKFGQSIPIPRLTPNLVPTLAHCDKRKFSQLPPFNEGDDKAACSQEKRDDSPRFERASFSEGGCRARARTEAGAPSSQSRHSLEEEKRSCTPRASLPGNFQQFARDYKLRFYHDFLLCALLVPPSSSRS